MQIVQMDGARAYANYCERYDDCNSEDLRRFSSAGQYLPQAAYMTEQKESCLMMLLPQIFLPEMNLKQSQE